MKAGISLMGILAALLLWGCGARGADAPAVDDSDRLFRGLLDLTSAYADSLANAPDSNTAHEAFRRFNEMLDSVNFSVAPDTDLLLTEGENDTLYQNITLIRVLYNERLRALKDTAK